MKRTVEVLKDESFDLLILGGGITGAGVALDAVLRGLRVALIDKEDFASGTSSVSSKLVHGGLRYLEYGHLPLVYEALQERRLLLHNAPHLVQPLRFVIPFYQGQRVAPWKWRLGLTLYDFLAGAGNLRRSRPLSLGTLRREFPPLRPSGLLGGATYFDAQMDDARVCLEVVRTAALCGARVANYVEAIAFETRSGEITGVRAVDRVGNSAFLIRARQVVNATGPWMDAVAQLAGDTSGPHLQPTKGAHLILPGRGFTSAFLLLHPRDGRVFFVIPWMGKTLLGTTDTLTEDGPDALTVTPAEVAYLLEAYHHYFTPALAPADILGSFAGLRPLIRNHPGEPSSLSREFRLFTSPSGLLSVAGGKYTTYRHMAEVITDMVVQRLGRRRRCRTHHFLLDGAPPEPWPAFEQTQTEALCRQSGLDPESARHLLRRYGRRASEVAQYPDGKERVVSGEPDLKCEFAYQRDREMAIFPEDHLLRRTRLGLFRRELLPPECTR
jgi:glycerol-3-phosphate dehydrogenase